MSVLSRREEEIQRPAGLDDASHARVFWSVVPIVSTCAIAASSWLMASFRAVSAGSADGRVIGPHGVSSGSWDATIFPPGLGEGVAAAAAVGFGGDESFVGEELQGGVRSSRDWGSRRPRYGRPVR